MGTTLLASNRSYRLLFSASAVSNLGDGIAMVALPWLATLLTRDPMLIASVATAQRLPWLLFALPAGVWTDRADRRKMMLRADIVRIALMVCIVGMVFSVGSLPVPEGAGQGAMLALVGLAFLFGTAEVFRDNAAQTILPAIVAKDDLERANGQMWSAEDVAGRFIGPPLAGALIAASVAVPFGGNALLYGVSALLVSLIVLPRQPLRARRSFWEELGEGLLWMRGNPTILQLAIMLAVVNFVGVGSMAVLVLYAQDILHLGAGAYGVLLTCGALGGVLGGIAAPSVAGRLGARLSLFVALLMFVLASLSLAITASVYVAGAALFIEGLAGLLWNVVTVSYRQRHIPDHLLGRVNSVYRFFGWGAIPFGTFAAGAVVALAEPELGRQGALYLPFFAAAGISFLLLVYAARRLRIE